MSGDPDEPTLRLRLFGRFSAWVDGEPLRPLASRKGQWLLALLALRGGKPVERAWLLAQLWPESDEPRAYRNLRQTLYDLRRALGPAAMLLESPTPHTLRLRIDGADVDVLAFDADARSGDIDRLQRAAEAYAGALLEECSEPWVLSERLPREQAYLTALERLAADARERGDLVAASDYLRRVLALDPLREGAQRTLIQVLAESGNHAAALSQYRDLRLLLRREMNADPDPETTYLFERLRDGAREKARAGDRAAAGVMSAPKTSAVPMAWRPARVAGSLPTPLTELIGRDEAAGDVLGLLRSSRLVTLTGTGGVGKTRLAVRVARQIADSTAADEFPDDPDEFPDGAWFAGLAPLSPSSDPEAVAQAVVRALGIGVAPGQDPADVLRTFLATRSLLLVLDNCEHLLGAVAELAEVLLSASPGLTVLATSREALGIAGEVQYQVPGLSLPDHNGGDATATAARVLSSDAGQLFALRARQALPRFAVTDANAGAVAKTCRQLDGLPLAIELAAARVGVLTPAQIVRMLEEQRFRLLVGGSRTAPERQQTLRATLEWSWGLLAEAEATVLSRLSVFTGGWTLEAAEQVCAFGDVAPEVVFELLAALTNKSLVVFDAVFDEAAAGGGAGRYRLLETVRQFAGERLTEGGDREGEEAEARGRHADYYLWLAEAVREAGDPWRHPERQAHLVAEHDNLLAALNWFRAGGTGGAAGPLEPKDGLLRLSAALAPFWLSRDYWREAREWLEAALEGGTDAAPPQVDVPPQVMRARARVLGAVGRLAWMHEKHNAAVAHLEEALAVHRALGEAADRYDLVFVLNALENALRNLGRWDEARASGEECVALSRAIGDAGWEGRMLSDMGLTAIHEGDLPRAAALCEQGLSVARRAGDDRAAVWSLLRLGQVACAEPALSPVPARALFEQGLALARKSGDRTAMGWLLQFMSEALHDAGEDAAARQLREEGLALALDLGDAHMVRVLGEGMCWTLLRQGEGALTRREVCEHPLLRRAMVEYSQYPTLTIRVPTGFGHAARGGAGNFREAGDFYRQSLGIRLEVGNALEVAMSLEDFAILAAREAEGQGRPEDWKRAARLFGAAAVACEALGRVPPFGGYVYERAVNAAREGLGESAFSSAWAEGRALDVERALTYVLEEAV